MESKIRILYDIVKNISFTNDIQVGSDPDTEHFLNPGEDQICTFTAATPGVVNIVGHFYEDGYGVRFSNSGGALPPEITSGQLYFVEVIDPNSFWVHEFITDVIPGSNKIAFSVPGTGTQNSNTIDKSTVFLASEESGADDSNTGTRLDPVSSIISGLNVMYLNQPIVCIHSSTNLENKLFNILRFRQFNVFVNDMYLQGKELKLIWSDINVTADFLDVFQRYGFALSVVNDSTFRHSHLMGTGHEITNPGVGTTNDLPIKQAQLDEGCQGRWFTRFVPGASAPLDRFELYWDRGNGFRFVTSQPRFTVETSGSGAPIVHYEYRILPNGDWYLCGLVVAVGTSLPWDGAGSFTLNTTRANIIGRAGNQFFETSFATGTAEFVTGLPFTLLYNTGGTAFIIGVSGVYNSTPTSVSEIESINVLQLPNAIWFRNLFSVPGAATNGFWFFHFSYQRVGSSSWLEYNADSVLTGTDENRGAFLVNGGTVGCDNFAGIIANALNSVNVNITIDKALNNDPPPIVSVKPFTPDGTFSFSSINYIGRTIPASKFTNRKRISPLNLRDINNCRLANIDYIRNENITRTLMSTIKTWESGAEITDFCTFFSILNTLSGPAGPAVLQPSSNGNIFHSVNFPFGFGGTNSVGYKSGPGFSGANTIEADPLFISTINPVDFRLRSVAGGYGIDSPAYLFVPKLPSDFQNAGALDDIATFIETSEQTILPRPFKLSIPVKGESFQINDLPDVIEGRDAALSATLNYEWSTERMELKDKKQLLDILFFSPNIRIYHDPVSNPDRFIQGVILKNQGSNIGHEMAANLNWSQSIRVAVKARLTREIVQTLGGWFV